MATYKVRDPQGNIREISGPDGASDADVIAQAKRLFSDVAPKPAMQQIDINGPKPESMGPMEMLGEAAMGGVRGAARLGTTAMLPIDAATDFIKGDKGQNLSGLITGQQPISRNEERERTIDQFMGERANTDSLLYKGGDIAAQIAGTSGVGGILGKGASKIPGGAKYAELLSSGGFKLGGADTGNKLANALLRFGGGAATGGAATAMVSPEDAGTGALISGATPLAVQGAAKVGQLIGSGLRSGSESMMQSALKPTIEQLRTGKADTAIKTLLDEGINPTAAGVEKLRGRVGDINSQIDTLIKGSGASVDKQQVIGAMNDTIKRFANQVSPSGDLGSIERVIDDFIAHPTAAGNSIPVQLAQELKKGTYRVLKDKAYGQLGSAEIEAQKALARGLKEGVAKAVPEVAGLNAQESKLLTTLKVAERRALMDANKNPMGLALLASHPATWAAFMADRSAAFKGLAARLANNASKAANTTKALENFAPPQALLTAPAVTGAAVVAPE